MAAPTARQTPSSFMSAPHWKPVGFSGAAEVAATAAEAVMAGRMLHLCCLAGSPLSPESGLAESRADPSGAVLPQPLGPANTG